jgi:hypothetical protein
MTSADTTAATDSMLRKVRGLLDKAENTEFEPEQEALFAKAAELMARYRITEAMVARAKPLVDRGEIVQHTLQLGSGQYVRARLALLCAVADNSCCRVLTHTGWDGRVGEVYGYESDVAAVEVLYTSLLVQATTAMSRAKRPGGRSGVEFRRSFLFGFANRVAERLVEANRSVAEEVGRAADGQTSRSVALVLVDRRQDVDDEVFRRVGRVGTLGRPKAVTRDGYADGRRAGDGADLHSGRGVADGRTPALDTGS